MRVLAPIVALAALSFAGVASAATVTIAPITFDSEFQTELNETIGETEAGYLRERVERAVTRALERAGAQVGPGGDATIEVVIVDADPNRPTFQELSDQPSLDYGRSISIGGAELRGVLRGADGGVIAEVTHDYYTPSLDYVMAAGTWTDAERAIRGFAEKLADAYAANAR
ncbi:MAG: hypothetical protein NW206_15410 [Hyphomonadaceae bacterium]|nr:hypothetical protein [Hyphomonadaceae bacterium]